MNDNYFILGDDILIYWSIENLIKNSIDSIKDKKGLVGLNPYPFFIDPTFKEREKLARQKLSKELGYVG